MSSDPSKELLSWIRYTRKNIKGFSTKLKEAYPELEIGKIVSRSKGKGVNDSVLKKGGLLLEGDISKLFPKKLYDESKLKNNFLTFMKMFSIMYLKSVGEEWNFNEKVASEISKGIREYVKEVLNLILEKEEDKGKDKEKEDKNNTEKIYIRYIDLDAKEKAKQTGKRAKQGGKSGVGVTRLVDGDIKTLTQLAKRYQGKVSGKIDWGDFTIKNTDKDLDKMFSNVEMEIDERKGGIRVHGGGGEFLNLNFKNPKDLSNSEINIVGACDGLFNKFCHTINQRDFKRSDDNYPKIEIYG
jgi:hypothetical protein